jgi:hypothetical protein
LFSLKEAIGFQKAGRKKRRKQLWKERKDTKEGTTEQSAWLVARPTRVSNLERGNRTRLLCLELAALHITAHTQNVAADLSEPC